MIPKVLFLVHIYLGVINCQSTEEIDYYVKLITEANKNVKNYQLPTNANQYFSNATRQTLKEEFDFVIIGAGTAGSVIASRLSDMSNYSILLLEAGDFGNNLTDIPNMSGPNQLTKYNWGYTTIPQKHACLGLKEHIAAHARGKGMGGTSLINGLVYSRGYDSDFNRWGKAVADDRWSYKNVLRVFKKSEDYHHTDPTAPYNPEYHGTGGYFRVEYHKPESPQFKAFLEANKELGYGVVDYNANQLGASQIQYNMIHGRRLDLTKAFIKPVIKRKNLHIQTESYVTKIVTEGRRAMGVEFSFKGNNYFVRAKREVILSAGAFGSPQILMLSGIGPKKHLKDVGIDVVADLEVGSILKDHPLYFGFVVSTNYTEPIKPLKEYVSAYLRGEGPYTATNGQQGVGFYESRYTRGTGIPDIEFEFDVANATDPSGRKQFRWTDDSFNYIWGNVNVAQAFNVLINNLHPISEGTLRLKSKNPYDYPIIDPKYLSDAADHDINILYDGIKLMLKMLETKPFKALNATLIDGTLKACQQFERLSKDHWYCLIRQFTIHLYHPQSTCIMGVDPKKGAVVNSKLQVFGFDNLRVADASVMPYTLAGHPNAAIVMIGEQMAEILKEQYQ